MTSRHPLAGAGVELEVLVSDGVTLGTLGQILKQTDKAAATAIRKRVRTAVGEAGAGLVDAVRTEASWSTRIPQTVRMVTSFSGKRAGVSITAGGKAAPHARPLEFGNKNQYGGKVAKAFGAAPTGRSLRHPVFGRPDLERDEWTWVDQPTRPFFFAAVDGNIPAMDRRVTQVLDEVAHDLGFTD